MSVTEIIENLRAGNVSIPTVAVSDWKKANPGSKVFGCFPVYTPVEIIHAAGMLPVTVAGAGCELSIDHSNAYMQAFICSIGRSTLEMKLDGYLDEIDGMVFPSVCEVSRVLSFIWQRHDPKKPSIYLHYPQNLNSGYAVGYMVGELSRFREAIEAVAGKKVSSENLIHSFKIYNQRSEALAELDRVRCFNPEKLSASDFYILRNAGVTVSPEDHIALLREVLNTLDVGESHVHKTRALLLGAFCSRPPVKLIESIEKIGVSIVSDDFLLGQRWWTEPLPLDGDPITSLAGHYVRHAVVNSVVHRKPAERVRFLLDLYSRTNAEMVIIAPAKFCYPANHDITIYCKTCEENGIPYLKFEYEENWTQFNKILSQVESMLEARAHLPFAGTESKGGISR